MLDSAVSLFLSMLRDTLKDGFGISNQQVTELGSSAKDGAEAREESGLE